MDIRQEALNWLYRYNQPTLEARDAIDAYIAGVEAERSRPISEDERDIIECGIYDALCEFGYVTHETQLTAEENDKIERFSAEIFKYIQMALSDEGLLSRKSRGQQAMKDVEK